MVNESPLSGCIGCSGLDKNAYMVAAPVIAKASPIARQTYPKRRCALAPLTMPHFAQNKYSP